MIRVAEAILISLSGGFLILSDIQHPEITIFNLFICVLLGSVLSWYFDPDWNLKKNFKHGAVSLLISAVIGFVAWKVLNINWIIYSLVGLTSFLTNFFQIKKSDKEKSFA